MLIVTYAVQLQDLSQQHGVDLLDAVRHAGVETSTFYRSIANDSQQLKQATAERIALAIMELSQR